MESQRLVAVLKPTAAPSRAPREGSPRPPDLRGRTVGFLYNLKFNGDRLIDGLSVRLKERYGVAATPLVQKHSDSCPAEVALLQELAGRADCVVTLLGD